MYICSVGSRRGYEFQVLLCDVSNEITFQGMIIIRPNISLYRTVKVYNLLEEFVSTFSIILLYTHNLCEEC
jgi:hypothetical protein